MHQPRVPELGSACRNIMNRRVPFAVLSGAVVVVALYGAALQAQDKKPGAAGAPKPDEEMGEYRRTEAGGVLAALQKSLETGAVRWKYDERQGYLPEVLAALKLPPESQVLVFSKTSPHRRHITPQNPRALYFNDRASVAYVPGTDVIELAAADPKLGVVFYSLEQKPGGRPRLFRDDRCLECHATSKTLNVPGLLVRSFLTGDDGDVSALGGKPMVTHRTPFAERWGGYYVTGTQGTMAHLGNLFGAEAQTRHQREPGKNGNITDLKPFLDLANYPAKQSDIVALMTLDHQAHMQNLLTLLNTEATRALRDNGSLRAVYPVVESVLQYLLFTDEAPLGGAVTGTTDFPKVLQRTVPKDARGRSLAEFDLKTRLFRYPCSYMIYSPSFDALPAEAKKHVYRRLWEILSGQDTTAEYARLTSASRRDLREILSATKPDLPAYWRLE